MLYMMWVKFKATEVVLRLIYISTKNPNTLFNSIIHVWHNFRLISQIVNLKLHIVAVVILTTRHIYVDEFGEKTASRYL